MIFGLAMLYIKTKISKNKTNRYNIGAVSCATHDRRLRVHSGVETNSRVQVLSGILRPEVQYSPQGFYDNCFRSRQRYLRIVMNQAAGGWRAGREARRARRPSPTPSPVDERGVALRGHAGTGRAVLCGAAAWRGVRGRRARSVAVSGRGAARPWRRRGRRRRLAHCRRRAAPAAPGPAHAPQRRPRPPSEPNWSAGSSIAMKFMTGRGSIIDVIPPEPRIIIRASTINAQISWSEVDNVRSNGNNIIGQFRKRCVLWYQCR